MIPEEFLPNNKRPVGSNLYCITLVSFVPKKNKAVVLVSTMHNNDETNHEKKKPEIICYYNSTKCGVDLLDMKCAVFTSSRKTRRWPLAIFYRMLNIGSVNSFIMYLSFKDTPDMTRFDYIKELGMELIVPHLRKRLADISNLPRELKSSIEKILMESQAQQHRRQLQQTVQQHIQVIYKFILII